MAFLEYELLRPRAETEAEFGDHGRRLQPAARWRRRHDVAGAVHDVEMHGVAAHGARLIEHGTTIDFHEARVDHVVMRPGRRATDSRFSRAGVRYGHAPAAGNAHIDPLAVAVDGTWPLFMRGRRTNERTPLRVVGVGQKGLARHFDEIGIAIESVAIR